MAGLVKWIIFPSRVITENVQIFVSVNKQISKQAISILYNTNTTVKSIDINNLDKKGKVVPLRSIEALWVTGGIAPTLS
jgi:hypothetical protein